MRVIALVNQKGGVGKSNCAVNLATELAYRGRRVLLCDADEQHTSTTWIFDERPHALDLGSLLSSGPAGVGATIVPAGEHWRFDVLPGQRVPLEYAKKWIDGDATRLSVFADLLAPLELRYDYVLIDCPPNLGNLVAAAAFASTDVLVPVNGAEGVDGLVEIQAMLARLARFSDAKLLGTVLTMYRSRTRLYRDLHEALRELDTRPFKATIRLSAVAGETYTRRLAARLHAPRSAVAKDYAALAAEVEERCG